MTSNPRSKSELSSPRTQSTMSSLRQHRIVIASLVLPTTVERQVPGDESNPNGFSIQKVASPQPTDSLVEHLIQVRPCLHTCFNRVLILFFFWQSRRPSKQPTPNVLTPRSESSNPFQKLPINQLESQPAQTSAQTSSKNLSQIQRRRSFSRRRDKQNNSAWNLEPNLHSNTGLKNALDSVRDRLRRVLWVGTLGTGVAADLDAMGEDTKPSVERVLLQQCQSVPVWVPDAEFESCYDKYCHQVLWPCLHYAIPDAPKTKFFDESAGFKEYLAVNKHFADTIVANYQDGDISSFLFFFSLLLIFASNLSSHFF
jgi:hypothetical protein